MYINDQEMEAIKVAFSETIGLYDEFVKTEDDLKKIDWLIDMRNSILEKHKKQNIKNKKRNKRTD